MTSMRLLLAAAAAVLLFLCTPAAADELAIKQTLSTNHLLSESLVPINKCQLHTTDELLGYVPQTSIKVYRKTCIGMCLSLVNKRHTCQSTTKTIAVASYPYTYLFNKDLNTVKKVRQVTGCECKPAACQVPDESGEMQTYEHGETLVNACNQKCECQYGLVTNCCRVRKEYRRGMTQTERERFIDTYKIVSTTAPYKATYDALVLLHGANFNAGIHQGQFFFPWHRWYILEMEELLQQVDCRVTVPYWDWASEATSAFSTSGSTIWGSGASELGGDGDASAGGCVTDGAFASPGWTTAAGACLTRSFNTASATPTSADIQSYIAANPSATPADYDGLFGDINGPHGQVHVMHGGTMSGVNSSLSPEFFLHHCFIDKVWADWQAQSAAHVQTYASTGSPNDLMPATTTGTVTPAMVTDLDAQQYHGPGGSVTTVRVCYEDAPSAWWTKAVLGPLPLAALAAIPRTPVRASAVPWMRNFSPVPRAAIERQLAREAERNDPAKFNLVDLDKARAEPADGVLREMGIRLDGAVLAPIDGKLTLTAAAADDDGGKL